MGRSQESFSKKEKEKKRLKKRKDKLAKKEERKANAKKGQSLEDMLVYVDEFGQLTDTPPDPTKKKVEIEAEDIIIGIPKKEEVIEEKVKQGKVAYFDHSKGYGFINEVNSQERYFCHVTGLIDEIDEGDKVSFELERGQKGMNAVKVTKV